jgi:two pore calcium channel protein
MGMVLFCRTAEGKASFFSWADAAASMWILFTTSNDPNQWIPAYSTSRYSAIFFVVFLVLMLYLLLSLLLAKIYATYQAIYAERGRKFDEKQDKAIDEAFRCLAEYQEEKEKLHINHAVWKAFFAESCNPHIGKISCGDSSAVADNYQQGTKLLEDIVPEMKKYLLDPFGGMSNRLFKKCALVFIDQGMYIPSKTQYKRWHADCCPSFTKFFLQGLDVGKWHLDWDSMVNVAIGVAMPITLWASISFARPRTIRPADFRHYLSFQLLFAISVVYTLGITVKISSLGFVRFWMSRNPSRKVQQRFDFFNVYLLLIAELIFFFLYPLGSIARIIIILHLCRGLRLLALVKPMLTLFKLVGMLIPVFWQYLLVMFVVYYMFAVIGQYWFGGLIYTTNPILAGTNFASAAFWPLNFNDLPSGFVTLFALMIVNNWYEIAQGYMFVTYNSWAAAYFVIFFVIINLIVLNIVLALILEFNAAMESEDEHVTKPLDVSSMDLEICAGVGSPYNASKILRKALTSSNALPDSDQEDSDGDGEIGTRKSSNIQHLRSRRLAEVEGYEEDDDDVGYSHAMTEGAATETHLYGTFGHSPTVSRGTRKLTDLDV